MVGLKPLSCLLSTVISDPVGAGLQTQLAVGFAYSYCDEACISVYAERLVGMEMWIRHSGKPFALTSRGG